MSGAVTRREFSTITSGTERKKKEKQLKTQKEIAKKLHKEKKARELQMKLRSVISIPPVSTASATGVASETTTSILEFVVSVRASYAAILSS